MDGISLPAYRDLPLVAEPGYRSAWGVFGDDDELGRLNLLTAAVVAAAVIEVRSGDSFGLSLPLDLPSPPWGGERQTYRHTMLQPDRNTQDDRLDAFYPQASSQWDGFRHVSAGRLGYYGGVKPADAGPAGARLGIDAWSRRGIVGRGVLVDIARFSAKVGAPLDPRSPISIGHEELAEILAHEGVKLRLGDILLVRTGYLDAYLDQPSKRRLAWAKDPRVAGLAADEGMAEFLWDSGIVAVVSDNPTVEVAPGEPTVGFLHRRLLALLGMPLGELFDLRALAAHCAAVGRFTCFFAAIPLAVPGGVGSPANAVAVC